ncbi:histidine kinase [Trichoderma novae-zelandiae]
MGVRDDGPGVDSMISQGAGASSHFSQHDEHEASQGRRLSDAHGSSNNNSNNNSSNISNPISNSIDNSIDSLINNGIYNSINKGISNSSSTAAANDNAAASMMAMGSGSGDTSMSASLMSVDGGGAAANSSSTNNSNTATAAETNNTTNTTTADTATTTTDADSTATPSTHTFNFDAFDLYDLSPVPTLVVSPSFRILRVSRGVADAWKRTRDELVGQDLFAALYGGSPLERFDRIPLASAIEVAVAARKFRLCHAAYAAQGVSYSARIVPIFRGDEMLSLVLEWDEIVPKTADIRGEIIQHALSVDEVFRLLIQTVKDYAIFLLDTRGYVATWNAGAELLKGYKKEDIIGRHFSNFYGKEELDAGKPENELVVCLREGRVQDEGWRYRKDGSRFWANVTITAIYRNGVHVGFGKVTRDLTERREAELRLVAAYEESAKLKNDFLANMSHEIRTPMHGMLSACALLLDTSLTDDQRDTANIISESGQVLLQVINGILDYSKLASGNFSVNTDLVGVASIITSVVRNVQMTLLPGVYIKLLLSPDLPKSAQGDPLRFRQIFQNIIDNAVKFTEKGSVQVAASVTGQDDMYYTILTEVTDSGIGVPENAVQNLFKPFTQLEKPTKKRYQGTGLGLSIAKSLAELLGGQMGYRPNRERNGSVFWFTVKLKKIANLNQLDSPGSQADRDSEKSRQEAEKERMMKRIRELAPQRRILAAEDNLVNQKVLARVLKSLGFDNTTIAANGAEAVSTLKASPNTYDLVLMDISMPVMDGFEATRKIRAHGMPIPIIAMTAYALRGDSETCLEKGMDDYISKPVNINKLLQKLLTWLDSPEWSSSATNGPS